MPTPPAPEAAPPCPAHLALLAAWFSPACPIGAYSYSHGLETLQDLGVLGDAEAAFEAIETALTLGAGRTDAILLAEGHRATLAADPGRLERVAALSLALAPSAERLAEAVQQAEAFAELIDAVWPCPVPLGEGPAATLAVVVGRAGAFHGVPLLALTQGFLNAFAASLVSAAVRLVPLGQTDGQRLTARLSARAIALSSEALAARPEDIGGAALGLDLASMLHEEQIVRLFRS